MGKILGFFVYNSTLFWVKTCSFITVTVADTGFMFACLGKSGTSPANDPEFIVQLISPCSWQSTLFEGISCLGCPGRRVNFEDNPALGGQAKAVAEQASCLVV